MYGGYGLDKNWSIWGDDDKDDDKKSDICSHRWEKTGASPIHGEIWYNCIYCEIAKEDYEKDK